MVLTSYDQRMLKEVLEAYLNARDQCTDYREIFVRSDWVEEMLEALDNPPNVR